MSLSLWHREQEAIGQACLTNSKSPRSHILGVAPTHAVKANGCKFTDQDGRVYVDYVCGLGTNLLGYGNELVNRAVTKAMKMGFSHSIATPYEVEAAEKLKELFPFIDRVKWVKTGSDACSAAIKIARAATGRKLVLSTGYHGWHQEFCDGYNRAPLSGTRPFEWGLLHDKPAAVILEPVETDASLGRREWLHALRNECTRQGIVLIFDEVITGFRWPKMGVGNDWNILPDLICLGKGIANGMPLACVAGKSELLDQTSYFVSSTYGGEVLSLAAATATMTVLQTNQSYNVDKLWTTGQEFQERFNAVMTGMVHIAGYPSRGVLLGNDLNTALFLQETAKAGLYFGKSFFYNVLLHAEADTTLKALEGIADRFHEGKLLLQGPLPVKPFAQKVRDHE